ncbi:MAG TPA: DUF1643 domain-containing protein [Xanthobacteraceae bacterium]|jgi:hypothetical protein
MQADLFAEEAPHEPGGKVKTALPKGMRGSAYFCGDKQQYRVYLKRVWGSTGENRYPLLIGMNPSTADAMHNDPTVTREIGFASAWGYEGLVKGNVCDYRASFPRDLLAPGAIARSVENLPILRKLAKEADKVVLCYGVLPKPLRWAADDLTEALRADGNELFCFGKTLLGFPRHPLYLPKDTALERF